ncbi:MAG: hypothetical protein JOY80_03600 [Candidatus Dormibacteraeota bacterium]|nr:hypothetical protein [Candidatus Dormibacteraeota bacterium]
MSPSNFVLSTRIQQRGLRRRLVLATLAISAFTAVTVSGSLHGFGIAIVLVLASLDIILIHSTDGLAFARTRSLDERQRALRDRAYRLGFRLFGLAVILLMVLSVVISALALITGQIGGIGPGFTQLDEGVPGHTLVAVAELVLMMPTLVIAWVDPGGTDAAATVTVVGSRRRARPYAAWLALPLLTGAWLGAALALPAQRAAAGTGFILDDSFPGATCRHFVDGAIVGAEFGATVGLRVEVCWNHTDAFVVGDSQIPLPASALHGIAASAPAGVSVPPNFVNPADPSLTLCAADSSGDFAAVASTECTATIDASGTLHYTVYAAIAPLPFSVGARAITLSLVVDRDGRVIAQP